MKHIALLLSISLIIVYHQVILGFDKEKLDNIYLKEIYRIHERKQVLNTEKLYSIQKNLTICIFS